MHPIIRELKEITEIQRASGTGNDVILVMLKERLQGRILHAIYSHEEYKKLCFVGGTALRRLENLPRVSEDLDFNTLKVPNLLDLGNFIVNYFNKNKLPNVDFSVQQSAVVYRLTIKFKVLFECGFSRLPEEKLHVKIEITETPERLSVITPIILDGLPIAIKHNPIEIMMSGKIFACLNRVWEKGTTGIKIKGRDYFDLIWYMEKGIIPDKATLKENGLTIQSAFDALDRKVEGLKAEDLYEDLQTFFPNQDYIQARCENFHESYRKYRIRYS